MFNSSKILFTLRLNAKLLDNHKLFIHHECLLLYPGVIKKNNNYFPVHLCEFSSRVVINPSLTLSNSLVVAIGNIGKKNILSY